MNWKRILIAEDNPDHRTILRYQLRRIGPFHLFEARNGQEALDVVTREGVDLIILDLKMPVLDGWEVIRRIRALPSAVCNVPILALTAYAELGAERQVRAAGCDAYIAKPLLEFTTLKDKVERLLTSGRL
jgi:two-component system cell cycle response regulator DivK